MKEQSGHITSKVILGYILLITIAVCSVAYIYNIVEKVAEEDEPDHQARRKVYLSPIRSPCSMRARRWGSW